MSYTPTEWKSGDTVTSAKLNKIEQGIVANKPPVICIQEDNAVKRITASVSYNDVIAALQNNIIPVLMYTEFEGRIEVCHFNYIANYDDVYYIVFNSLNSDTYYALFADSPTEVFHFEDEEAVDK